MQNNDFSLLQDLYTDHLAHIESIHFTSREIDVMACLLKARGTSKISSLLKISSHTVITHVRNIMSKLECSSREGVIDFIEKSHKSLLFKQYYTGLVIFAAFTKSLEKISKLKKERGSVCLIFCGKQQNNRDAVFQYLENHLEQAGLQVEILHESFAHKIKQEDDGNILVLLSTTEDLKDLNPALTKFESLILDDSMSYYFSVFDILRNLLPSSNLDPIISEFKSTYEAMGKSTPTSNLPERETEEGLNLPKQTTVLKKTVIQIKTSLNKQVGHWILALFFVCFVGMGFWTQYAKQPPSSSSAIRSDLILPTAPVLLNRPELMTQLDAKFKGQDGIQAVALVGMGGVGKTTLARHYASTQKAPLIWQIKAETSESLKNSFEDLAVALTKTVEDEKALRALQDIQDPKEKEKKVLSFVKERIKNHPYWFLIYDNVEDFSDIQDYFPQDSAIWGPGRIILTTRDINIQNNKHITHVIPLGELGQPQKLTLFVNIMTNGNPSSFTFVQKKEAIDFLTKIPPFPLDVALAAYYIKATSISYENYLGHLTQWEKGFENVQENVLKGSGDYAKTRYHIVALSIKQLCPVSERA